MIRNRRRIDKRLIWHIAYPRNTMHSPALLMSGLLDYLVEQAKDIDPAAFTLSKITDFKKTWADLESLPWIDFNVETDGEPTWLRVHRLEATRPPALSEPELAPYLVVSDDPFGKPPALTGAGSADAFRPQVARWRRTAAGRESVGRQAE